MNPALIQQQQQQRHGCKLSLSLWGQQTWQEIRISIKCQRNPEKTISMLKYQRLIFYMIILPIYLLRWFLLLSSLLSSLDTWCFYQYHHDNHDVIINTIDHRYYMYVCIYITRIIMICHWGNTCSTWWWCKPSNPRPLLMGRQRMGRRINSCFSSNWDPSDRGKVTGTGGFIH